MKLVLLFLWIFVYNQKLVELLDDNNIYEQISPQTILKNLYNSNKSYKKLVSKRTNFVFC